MSFSLYALWVARMQERQKGREWTSFSFDTVEQCVEKESIFLHRAGREKKIAQQVVGAQSCMSHKVCVCVCVYFGDPVTSGALQVCASA